MNVFKGRRCQKCGILLSEGNKSGFCTRHRDRSGKNNPFFGKSHSKETLQKSREKIALSSKRLWQDPEYRKKVIKAMSKLRSDKFKKEQSERVKKWYKENRKQREIRSVSMKNSWSEGKIVSNNNRSINRSKGETKLALILKEIISDKVEVGKTLCIGNNWYFPDIYIKKDNRIIEFYGDYWHANPKIYRQDEIVYYGRKAKDIWEHDKDRLATFSFGGYLVDIIWESDFKENMNYIINKFDQLYNWESCSF